MKVKKVLSLVLAVVLVFSMIPIQLITSAGIEKNKYGDNTDFYVEVSLADKTTGKYYDKGCIDVALRAVINYDGLSAGSERKLASFNQIIKIDPEVVGTVSKKSSTRGNWNMDAMITEAQNADGFIGTGRDWAIVANPLPPYEDAEQEEYVPYKISPNSTLRYDETSGKVYIQLGGYQDDEDIAYENQADGATKTDVILIHLYLAPKAGKTLQEVKNAIALVDDAEGTVLGDEMAENFSASFANDPATPNSSNLNFSSEFDPVSSYTVTFTGIKKADGTAADDVEITNDGVDEFEVPTLVNYTDGNFTYTANGWDKEVVNPATADATYTAQYTKTKNDASSLQTEVTSDEALKEEDYQSGWDTFAQKLAAAQTVLTNNASENPADWPTASEIETALNDLVDARRALVPVAATYNITFVWQTAEGEQSTTVPFTEGAQIVAPEGSEAAIDADTYTQAFQGWKDSTGEVVDLPTCSGEATFTAQYADPVAKTIAISFTYRDANAELTTLDVPAAELGTSAANYAPNAQTVTTADGNTTYEFTGWSPALDTVSADVTAYTAQYNEVANKADYSAVDNAILAANEKTGETDYAKKYTEASRQVLTDAINGVVRDLPVSRQGDVDAMATAITDAITALTLQDYTITYVVPNSDPTTETFQYGATAQDVAAKAPAAPESYDDGDYHYTLTGWSPDFAAVDGNATYTAQYDSAFVPADTSALQTAVNNKIAERDSGTEWTDESVAALNQKLGEAEQYLNPPAQIGQSQQGAIDALTNAIKNSTLVPKGQPVTTYTIVFQDWDGSEISTQTVNPGDTITVPENPTRPDSQDGNTSYTFTGWGKDVVMVPTQDETYTAQYSETTNYADLTALNDAISAAQQKQAEENFNDKYANAQELNDLVSQAKELVQSTPKKSEQGTVNDKAAALNGWQPSLNTFNVIFVTHEGAAESVVNYGETPVAPETPNYTENDYEYSFLQWTVDQQPAEIVPATANVTYVAKYSSQFLPADYSENELAVGNAESILTTPDADKIYTADTLAALQNAVNNNVQPGLGESQQQQVDNATAAINNAIAGLQKITYTVTFYVEGQAEPYATGTYNYNVDLVVPVDPVKQEDDTYTYAFEGWNPQVSQKVTADATYTAQFAPTYKEYIIKFMVEGEEYKNYNLHYGDSVTVPEDPTKPDDLANTYDFAGWTPDITNVTGNATYTAEFSATPIDYNISFYDAEGTEIAVQTYHYGDTIVPPEAPEKAADAYNTYVFAGWSPEVPATVDGTGDGIYTATYNAVPIEYTVTFTNDDDKVISTATYHYGDTVVVPADPTKDATASIVYTFAGWTPDVVTTVAGDATYKATYNTSPRMYTVTIVTKSTSDASPVTETRSIPFGDTPVLNDPADFVVGNTKYTFTGWDPEVAAVDGDVTYTAQYEESTVTGPTYVINFKYADTADEAESGTYADHNVTLEQGAMPTVPEPHNFTTATASYEFIGWDKEVGAAEADVTYTAQYKVTPIVTAYTINFRYSETLSQVQDGHLVDHFQTVNKDEMPVVPTPGKYFTDGTTTYTFVGWNKAVEPATGDAVYTAVYNVDTPFIPDMTEIEQLVERYKQMVKTGLYNKDDLAAVKAYIDDIYDIYDSDEFTSQEQVDEMAAYLRYLVNSCRKIEKEDEKKEEQKKTTEKKTYTRTSRTSVATGDNATLIVMSVILVASIGLAVVTLAKRRKEDF